MFKSNHSKVIFRSHEGILGMIRSFAQLYSVIYRPEKNHKTYLAMKKGLLGLLLSFYLLGVNAQQQATPNLSEAEKFCNTYFDIASLSRYVADRVPQEYRSMLDSEDFKSAVLHLMHKGRFTVMHQYQQGILTHGNVMPYLDSVRNLSLQMAHDFYNNPGKRHLFIEEYADKHSHDKLHETHGNRGPGDPCTNVDFELGNTSGWDLFVGRVDGSSQFSYTNVSPTGPGGSHVIVTAGNDPVVPAIPRVNPDGGTYSLMLGNGTGTGNGAASIRQTFLVSSNNAIFTYSYAAILQDASHAPNEQPYLVIRMYDQNNAPIACGDFSVVAGPPSSGGDPDFILTQYSGVDLYYKNWTTVFAPLNGYMGQNVTIEFITGDCSQSGHFGYAYIDAKCTPMDIIASSAAACGGQPVILTAPAGAASYAWSGPTGNFNTQSISTTVAGTYTVTLTPVTGSACTITLDTTITASPFNPTANFTHNGPVCANSPMSFTDASTGNGATITEWSWNFGDNSTSTLQNPTHSYSSGGTYTVALTVTTADGCTHTYSTTVQAEPGADATINPVGPFCITNASPMVLTAAQGGGVWSGPGITNPSTGAFNPVAAGVGTHNIVYSIAASGPTCGDTDTLRITISPAANATVAPAGPFCLTDGPVTLQPVQPGGTWSGPGVDPVTGVFTPSAVGTPNTVMITYTINNGCNDSKFILITVNDESNATITPVGPFCANAAPTTLVAAQAGGTWSGSGITNASTGAFSPAAAGAGQHQIIYTIPGSCGDSDTVLIEVLPNADATITQAGPFCTTSTAVTLSAATTGGTWGGPGVDPVTGLFNPATAGAGAHTITYTIGGQCGDSKNITIQVNPTPTADAGPNVILDCNDLETTLSASPTGSGYTYDWTTADGTIISGGNTATPLVSGEGIYIVTVTAAGCSSSAAVYVAETPGPGASFTANPSSGDAPLEVDFTNTSAGAGLTYHWDFGTGDTSILENPTYTYVNYGTYVVTLTVTDANGCTSIASMVIIVNDKYEILIPNVFSPNGDGSNDVFTVVSLGVKDIDCKIFDRWGTLIYEWTGVDGSWNGKRNGDGGDASEGTYFYIIWATKNTGEKQDYHGTVTLIRK